MSQISLAQLFQEARTHNDWLAKPVSDQTLHDIYDLMKWGPTSANSTPARIVFVRDGAAKETLLKAMQPGNVEKTRKAPVTAILAHDLAFYDHLPKLFPHADARSWFVGNPDLATETAKTNGFMQNAYFIIAARALGLDAGPMAGFDRTQIDAAFFAGSTWRSNLIVNLGYGDVAKLYPRNPRLAFAEACQIIS